ncbi:hypothetical protein NPA07_01220 [Mycoplasmopsis caviae]|uniref:Uncharacterized protein n=1 Tax=Mycoplasmopsis caviae TaxID=55603 RepID=A0A3P8L6T6_9BACT|nr:hypothetical protein [Mycoplasmopsis caviae]UUD35478.1 hypothetical protein NPA07_01220 [Mycoplasmopsis caviae]VDR41745.1 Uncharacterised protein [Mycoplasmopsis caviae]
MFRTLKEKYITLTVIFALTCILTIISAALLAAGRFETYIEGNLVLIAGVNLGVLVATVIFTMFTTATIVLTFILYNLKMAKRIEDFKRFKYAKLTLIFVFVALILYSIATTSAFLYFVLGLVVKNMKNANLNLVSVFSDIFSVLFYLTILVGLGLIVTYYVLFNIIYKNISRARREQAKKNE